MCVFIERGGEWMACGEGENENDSGRWMKGGGETGRVAPIKSTQIAIRLLAGFTQLGLFDRTSYGPVVSRVPIRELFES